MKGKFRTILIYVLSALLIATLFTASLTVGRYSGEYASDGNYDGDVEYVVSNQVEISSVEEFFAAIENGYSNIIIADDMDNPLIISGGVNDIHSDLVIDLNGHEIQRNNRQPLLNLTSGVRLTIIDTADGGGGSFYNPVGGVLQVSGGTLTVSAGLFESGPRNGEGTSASEYAFNSDGKWTTDFQAFITGETETTVEDKSGNTAKTPMPVIIPGVWFNGEGATYHKTVNGNMYFAEAYGSNAYIGADTYLYFTLDDVTVQSSNITAEGSADYVYSYYLKSEADGRYSFDASSRQTGGDNVKVTVYIYQNVKGSATDAEKGYSAISMQSGNLYVRGGEYQSYFGLDTTYCVNATGGYMAVESGDFYTFDDGVCINCNYEGKDQQNEYLRVSNGNFYSEKGDTISVAEGRMLVSGGKFVKNASQFSAAAYGENNSVININGGSLTLGSSSSGVDFSIYGDGINGIYSGGGAGVQVYNASFGFLSSASYEQQNANNSVNFVRGIYSGGGTITCNGNTQIIIGDCGAATSSGSSNIGIHADGGRVECKGNTEISVSYTTGVISCEANYGIFADGGTVSCEGSTELSVCGSLSTGIYADGGSVTIGGSGVNADSFGCLVEMPESQSVLSSTAVSTVGGNINFYADTATINSNGLGITVGGGNVTFAEEVENVSLTTTRGTALYVYGGSLNVLGQSTVLNISSTIEDGTRWTVDTSGGNSGGSDTGVSIYNGIYIQGGSLISEGTLNVAHKGLNNDEYGSGANAGLTGNNAYLNYDIKSYAIRVAGIDTTEVRIVNGIISNSVGGGVYVSGGEVIMGAEGGQSKLSVSATGKGVYDKFYKIDGAADNWQYKLPSTGGPSVKVDGGKLEVYGGNYSSAQGDGIVLSEGIANIYGGTFIGADSYEGGASGDPMVCGAAASYCLKVYGGTANIYSGTFGDAKEVTSSDITSSGAFVMGTSENNKGIANIYSGVFNVAGQAAFSIYQYATVTFGTDASSDIYLRGSAAGLTVEQTTSGGVHINTEMTIVINGGEFHGYRSSGGDGIWTGNAYADILINGGQFFGETRNGLNVGGGTVKISGGKFYGGNGNAVNGSYSVVNASTSQGTEYVNGKNYNVMTFTPVGA